MKQIIILTVLILFIGSFIINLSFATPTTTPPIRIPPGLSITAEQYPLCPAGYMVMHGVSPRCAPMPVNDKQALDVQITPLTMIKEFEPNAPIPVSHTRLILSDRFGIHTNYWWPTLVRTQFATTPTHAIIIETTDPKSQSKALEIGFRQATPEDLPRLMLCADPYIGTELSSSGGSTWPNITIGNAPWWWPYTFSAFDPSPEKKIL
jgi:hypothetical protein